MIVRPAQTERIPGAPAARGRVRRYEREPPVGPLGVSSIIASLAFLLAGIVWPQAAGALLRLLLATLAVVFIVARAYEAVLPARTTEEFHSPFDGDAASRTPPAAPRAVRESTRQLRAADDARLAQRAAIPRSVRWTVIEDASRRLAEHHGLSLDDPSHHEPIRSLVSEPTWLLIGPRDPEPGRGTRPAARTRRVPLSQLGLILDDVERL